VKRNIAPSELARDGRFHRISTVERFSDPRNVGDDRKMDPGFIDVADRARRQMHGIFVGEIQALEGAGRTAWDYDSPQQVPLQLKLDMARQAWDEARHCEISCKLNEHMGIEVGEFAEATTLFEAACHDDPVFRLAGVNRALEGLAIDVYTTMRDFGHAMHDPVLEFCEDWMLADEVTHVKMGSDWLRKLTANDKPRQERALEFQRVVDKLFSLGGFRGEEEDSPVRLARRFRELAGFQEDEMDTLAEIAKEARQEMDARIEANRAAVAG
jgi:uncharacterized ferritin-like protein (DUF455 family)